MKTIDRILDQAQRQIEPFMSLPYISVKLDVASSAWMPDFYTLAHRCACEVRITMRPAHFGGMEVEILATKGNWQNMIALRKRLTS